MVDTPHTSSRDRVAHQSNIGTIDVGVAPPQEGSPPSTRSVALTEGDAEVARDAQQR
jgi:hypothetical protein